MHLGDLNERDIASRLVLEMLNGFVQQKYTL